MDPSPEVPLPYRIVAQMQERNRLFAFPLEQLAEEYGAVPTGPAGWDIRVPCRGTGRVPDYTITVKRLRTGEAGVFPDHITTRVTTPWIFSAGRA